MSKTIIFSVDSYATETAHYIADMINKICKSKDSCSVALAGGQTPKRVYQVIAEESAKNYIPWDKVDIFFGDERCVPPNHQDSNYRMAELKLFSKLKTKPRNIFRIAGEKNNFSVAAKEYEKVLPEQFDLLLLGIGNDGHTASLFPNADTLHETKMRVMPTKSPLPPFSRITITPPVIKSAKNILVLATGNKKTEVVNNAMKKQLSIDECPATILLNATWLLDEDIKLNQIK